MTELSPSETSEIKALTKAERTKIEREYEAVRAPVGNLYNAARRAFNAGEALEWALAATDPKCEWNKGNFDHDYAAKQLAEAVPAFRDLLDDLRAALHDHGERITDA